MTEPYIQESEITPEEFLKRKRLSLATYFSLALGFSFPILEALFKLEEEEVILISFYPQRTEEVKGRWIYDPPPSGATISGWIFIFSKPARVYMDKNGIYTPNLDMPIWIGGQKIAPDPVKQLLDFSYKWCAFSSQKFSHYADVPIRDDQDDGQEE